MPILLFIFGLLLTMSPISHADDVYTVIVKKKQEEKKRTRWTLSEWLETKERNRWMDQWLAMNSASPYEFFLDASNQWVTSSSDGNSRSGFRFQLAAYASIFGLQLERVTGPVPTWSGLFNLRVFGFHVQSSNLTLQAGLNSRSDSPTSPRSAILGGSTALYVAKNFGVDGFFRHEFLSSTNGFGERFSSNRFEVGPFIDFSLLRIYGTYTRSFETQTQANGITGRDVSNGFRLGARVFL